jgi:hypothetical protein
LDGRTAKRRLRILEELKRGTDRSRKRDLKPIDVLLRVQALLDLGEPIASIRKSCRAVKPVEPSEAVVTGVRDLHAAYRFSPSAYQFVGIDEATLKRAGIVERNVKKAGERPLPRGPAKPRSSVRAANESAA